MPLPSLSDGWDALKKYGVVGVCCHYTVSFTALAAIYLGVMANKDWFLAYAPAYIPRQGFFYSFIEFTTLAVSPKLILFLT